MTELPDIVKRALGVHDAIAADLAHFGGVLRCGTCSAEQPVGDVASHLRSGWPQCCGKAMTWVTRKQLLAEAREVPDGYELVAVSNERWRLTTEKTCSRQRCTEPSAAEFNRGQWRSPTARHPGFRRVDAWWAYCLAHFENYGNWIENGQIMHWILREVETGA